MKNPIRRIRPERTGVRAPLGELEMAVMRYVWSCESRGCQGGEVQMALQQERPVALTTILTTLDRLAAKGIVIRKREGKAHCYRAALTEDQLQQRIVEGVLGDLIARFPRAVATYLAQQGICDNATNTQKLAALARRIAEAQASTGGEPTVERPTEEDSGQ